MGPAVWREAKEIFRSFAACFALFWLFSGPLVAEAELGFEKSLQLYLVALFLMLAVALLLNLEPQKLELKLSSGNVINLVEGDIFEYGGSAICFSISNTLETNEEIISRESLTHQVVEAFFAGDSVVAKAAFIEAFNAGNVDGFDRIQIPAVTTLNVSGRQLFPVAAFKMNDEDMVETTIPILLDALDLLWRKIRSSVDQRPVAMSLIGGGFGRLNISNFALLQLIILSYVSESKRQPVTGELNIFVPKQVKNKMRMSELKSWFKYVIMGNE